MERGGAKPASCGDETGINLTLVRPAPDGCFYGVTRWWTSELYLEGQSTSGQGSVFTGWRLENRFRPLVAEHAVNPVLYLEYENINEASRIEKEIVGKAPLDNQSNAELSQNHAHELEGKLILSSNLGQWNVAENFIAERNLTANEGFEFGYAFGVSHPLATAASMIACRFCIQNFVAGRGSCQLRGGRSPQSWAVASRTVYARGARS
jgi:hypothetical protein